MQNYGISSVLAVLSKPQNSRLPKGPPIRWMAGWSVLSLGGLYMLCQKWQQNPYITSVVFIVNHHQGLYALELVKSRWCEISI